MTKPKSPIQLSALDRARQTLTAAAEALKQAGEPSLALKAWALAGDARIKLESK